MKPEQWVIDDIRLMRQKQSRAKDEDGYLNLLLWYTKLLKEK